MPTSRVLDSPEHWAQSSSGAGLFIHIRFSVHNSSAFKLVTIPQLPSDSQYSYWYLESMVDSQNVCFPDMLIIFKSMFLFLQWSLRKENNRMSMQQFQLGVQGEYWKWFNLSKMSDKGRELQMLPHMKNVLLVDNTQSPIVYSKDGENVHFGHHKTQHCKMF